MHYTRISPIILPSPPPAITATAGSGSRGTMSATLFMALLLPCVGLCIVFLIYLFLLWCSTRRRIERLRFAEPVKPVIGKGLSVSELAKLPKLTGKELALAVRSTECAVCLENIESCQSARLVPGCNHGFHQLCADTWLSNHTVCPVCRGDLAPKVLQLNHSPC
ncbi:E3 ubiquitin-protein ligase ATL23 [Raphanus sativus]|uniref:RING-type E3 ubiquitin transferase n=1 Tax=Raphanus sativus TaxID=3726 RepID=A0A6J0JMB8_RAPSA|nr:E3 ubiquitin-protein ligase ATL23 [Raphanus sativus]KAJ4888834.1 E3 ubiquitin-protein ligase ATL23 [Raphanus sativus]